MLAENDCPEIMNGTGTVAIEMDNGYGIVLRPTDVFAIAVMAADALLPPGGRLGACEESWALGDIASSHRRNASGWMAFPATPTMARTWRSRCLVSATTAYQ